MRITTCLICLSLLSACASGRQELAKPDGQVFRFNPERWAETVNDVPPGARHAAVEAPR